jgi:ATP phosphoribosyltransferase
VATKYPRVARDHYASVNREIEIIKLNGSIELAPILGLSDVILDVVESGKTLAENDLGVLETVHPVTARLIANRSSYMFKESLIREMTGKLRDFGE